MNPAPQIPSHLRFLIAGIQDRAMDLALLGHTGVKAELDIDDAFANFELVTRPGYCQYGAAASTHITARLSCVLGVSDDTPLDEAMAEARQQMAAMLDHLNTLIDQELPA